ncbi:DUF4189 domain-containing protein [Rhodanobacter sp. BL-MT-08]
MKTTYALIPLFFVFCTAIAAAQCATGVDTGGECVPPDELSPQQAPIPRHQPQQPRTVWADRWGAIAIDSGTSSVGVSENQTSKSAASAESLQRCASKSNSQHCKLELAYGNGCAALAWGATNVGFANDETQTKAQNSAMETCQANGSSGCKIVYSACSLPVRVQ